MNKVLFVTSISKSLSFLQENYCSPQILHAANKICKLQISLYNNDLSTSYLTKYELVFNIIEVWFIKLDDFLNFMLNCKYLWK